jgi:predicted HNH restriction endonuclease
MKIDSLKIDLEEYINNTDNDAGYKKTLIEHFNKRQIWISLRNLEVSEYEKEYFNLKGREFSLKLSQDGYQVYPRESSNRDAYSNVHKYLREVILLNKEKQAQVNQQKQNEYSIEEKDTIDSKVLSDKSTGFNWNKKTKEKSVNGYSKASSQKYKRDTTVAVNALIRANFLCEYDNSDRVFLRKGSSNRYYTEAHHLIPLSEHNDFEYSLDIEENVVSLCSHCHNLLHYGRYEDKKEILQKLYDERVDVLRECKIDITFEQLLNYYR